MAYKAWFEHWLDPAFDKNLPTQCRTINAKMIADKNESDEIYRGLLDRIVSGTFFLQIKIPHFPGHSSRCRTMKSP